MEFLVKWNLEMFWYNKLTNQVIGFSAAFNIDVRIHRFIVDSSINDDMNILFPNSEDYEPTDIPTIKSAIEYCFNSKFLPFFKSKIQEEGGVLI